MASAVWYIIVNPCSGSGKTISEWEKAKEELDKEGVDYIYVMTEKPSHATELAYAAAKSGHRKFVAVGGDGTINELFTGVMRYVDSEGAEDGVLPNEFTIGVIPIGSGNDWIKSTAVPNDAIEAARLIASNSISTQDVVRVTGSQPQAHYMVNVGGVGFDAMVCDNVNKMKAQGYRTRLIYLWALLKTLGHYRSCPMEVECDGKIVYSGPCYSIALANGKYSGGGFRQTSPMTSLNDGLLDLTVIPDVNFFQIMTKLPSIVTGELYHKHPVKSFRGKEIVVRPISDRREIFEIDGEVLGQMPVKFEILNERVNIIVGNTK